MRYATERCVTVVPEIDMPEHAEAALAPYLELSCFGQPVEVPRKGFTKNIFCAGKEHTVNVLKDILDEVCELFPSPYIHLGGDEAPKGNWDNCKDCQQRIADLKLKDSHDLQLWFSAGMSSTKGFFKRKLGLNQKGMFSDRHFRKKLIPVPKKHDLKRESEPIHK